MTTPVMVNGTLYATAGVTRDIVAIDPATGQLLWLWREQEGERFDKAPRKGSGKGLAYWTNGTQETVLTVTPGYYLVALNAKTGLPVESFGAGGWVDLQEGLRLGPGRDDIDIGLSFPPLVVDDVIIVGASHLVSMRPVSATNVKGDIRGYDARTGALLWTFHTIPAPGEFGNETWLGDSASYTGNAGVWSAMSADPELGLVYLPVETPTGGSNWEGGAYDPDTGILLTKTLLFSGEGPGGKPLLRAHDKATGGILTEVALPAAQTGTPASYMHAGKQYPVLAVSGGGKSKLVALALP